MSIKKIRNEKFHPFIKSEGVFIGNGLSEPPTVKFIEKEKLWHENLEPRLRLFYHNTLSSTRRHANFMNVKSPRDSLDIILSSEYNHSDDLFRDKEEVFRQPETNDKETFRRLRNTQDIYINPPVYLSHPLKIGGISERKSIYSVKLINSGVHGSKTNHGYSRQNVDGNFFNY
ncbi:CLUMA_CG020709, isoform A [Clunio marinus]|uniref:CLUMA_CG020709, isoform A n=1 Tax=Clunio marinus TaxID=568069 RepID=A0A1J1J5S2_9DIPT|nr:CLUMA_CG020709, isoform A [Clunio marinus]